MLSGLLKVLFLYTEKILWSHKEEKKLDFSKKKIITVEKYMLENNLFNS